MIWLFLLILLPSPAWAAIASVNTLIGTGSSIASGSTLPITLTLQMDAGNPTLIRITSDNINTGDGDFGEVQTVTDTAGNTYTKVCEHTNGQGVVGDGITASLWLTLPTTNLAAGQPITVTFASAIVSKAGGAHEFTVGGGNTLALVGTCQTAATDGIDPPSQAISGLSSAETLFYRLVAGESFGSALTVTTNFTELASTQANNASSSPISAEMDGEFRIVTATGETSDPTMTNPVRDRASIFVALREVSAAAPAIRRRGMPMEL